MKILTSILLGIIIILVLDRNSEPSLGEQLYSFAVNLPEWWSGRTTIQDSQPVQVVKKTNPNLSLTRVTATESDKFQTNQGLVDVSYYEIPSPLSDSKLNNPIEIKITLVDKSSGPLPNAYPFEGQLFIKLMKLDEKRIPLLDTIKIHYFPPSRLRHKIHLLPGSYYIEAGYKSPQPSKSGSPSRIVTFDVLL